MATDDVLVLIALVLAAGAAVVDFVQRKVWLAAAVALIAVALIWIGPL